MCFVNDCDWFASVYNLGTMTVEKPTKCLECYGVVPYGATLHTVHMQEHEECHVCEYGECDCPKDKDGDCKECKCDPPDYGERFHYHRCEDCNKFLNAIQIAEEEAGCGNDEARPLLTEMRDQLREAGPREAKKYYQVAMREYPELKDYLTWLWRRLFAWE